ncbi:MAG: DUF2326 domain-containing protein [Saprospiraceae bacterium]|nr:DUF2326 domain-containing protein [Saprospiraceae bacterium]
MLVRLYSETNLLLHDVPFEPGINIVLGRYSGKKEATGVNGIGKSSLVRLINYCFLSRSAEKIFESNQYEFLRKDEHNIALEFQMGGKRYFIKRYFAEKSKVHFGTRPDRLEMYEKQEAKEVLNNIFFPTVDSRVVLEGNRFGTLLNFFVKDDLENQKRIEPLDFFDYSASTKDIALYNFFLLNLPTRNLARFAELTTESKSKSDTVTELTKTLEARTGRTVQEFRSEKLEIESRILRLERTLGDYKFLEQYKNIENELVELTKKINDRLEAYHSQNHELKRLRELYTQDFQVDTVQVQKIYNEVRETFGDLVRKKLDEVIAFRQEILENRNRFLLKKEQQLTLGIQNELSAISKLEEQRSVLYQKLKEKGALESIENIYKELINERSGLESAMSSVNEIDRLQEIIADQEVIISEVKRDIQQDLKDFESIVARHRASFKDILNNALFLGEGSEKAYFDVDIVTSARQQGNLPFKINVEIPKSKSHGNSRLKLIAYDLMVFLGNIRQGRKLPDFLIHDGVYHAISHKTKVNTLNYIAHEFNKNPTFQYIVTFNEDELEVPESKEDSFGTLDFNWRKNVVIELEDTPEKMLFKRDLT